MGLWLIVVPEETTNLCLNPSAEETGNHSAHGGGSVTRSTTYARHGIYSYYCGGGGTNRGINLTLQALANAIHYVTFYARRATGSAITGTLQVSLNSGTNWNNAAAINGAASDTTDRWARFGVQIPAAQANGSTSLLIRNSASEDWYIDAIQIEQKDYATTYIDGSLPGGRWAGLTHASTSSRNAQYRLGGRIRDLYDDYGIGVYASSSGYGMPAIANELQSYSIEPGAEFVSSKTQIRYLNLQVDVAGTSLADYHADRKALIDLVKPDAVRGNQPLWIGYSGAHASRTAWAQFRYDGGLEGGGWSPFSEQAPLRLVAVDPYWYEDSTQTASLTVSQSVTNANYALRRVNGRWQSLGTGFNGGVRAVAEDRLRGRVYFGGSFTTANGVTVNGVCYWNGTTFVPMGSGTVGVSGGTVLALAVAFNGDVWVGGEFTGAGGATTHGIARWNNSTNTWTQFTLGAGATFAALAFNRSTGVLYAGGNFVNWNGNPDSDGITSYDGTNWSNVGAPTFNSIVQTIAVGRDGSVYAGGLFTTPNNRLSRWNGSTWGIVGTGIGTGGDVDVVFSAPDGSIYVGGSFTSPATRVARWNGSIWLSLGSGTNNQVRTADMFRNGLMVFGGNFTIAGGLALADRMALWNGSTWTHMDVDLPGTPTVDSVRVFNDDLYIGYSTAGTATAAGINTITTLSGTRSFPIITIVGPSSGSSTLQWLENQSSDHRLYFNLLIQAGEIITIDLRPDRKLITSNWRDVITDNPLENSDLANWALLPGSNTVAAFVTGSVPAAAVMNWTPTHWSADGAAS